MPFPIAAAGAAIQGIAGVAQLFGGLFTKKPKRPEYEIQSEYQKNIDVARGIKNMGGMDKASYESAIQNIGRTQATGISGLQDRRSAMAGVGALVQRSNDALLNLEAISSRMAQQNFLQGSRMEMAANESLADQKNKKFQWDKLQPYLDKTNQRNAMIGAGMQNIAGSAQSLALLGAGKDLGGFGKKNAGVNVDKATADALTYDVNAPGHVGKHRLGAVTFKDESYFDYLNPSSVFGKI